MKKLFAVLVALTLVLTMGTMAMADETKGTISITNAVENHTYTIYKMLDFTASNDEGTAGVYTIADGWEAFITGEVGSQYFKVSADGKVSLKEGKTPDSVLAKAAIAYATTTAAVTAAGTETVAAGDTSVTFSDLDFGYYAVDTTVGTICSLTRATNESKLVEKNTKPELIKKIVENGQDVDANNVAIGDTVTYKATITIGEGVENYIMHDKMSAGLDFGEITSVVASNNSTPVYTVVEEPKHEYCDFELVFDNDYTSGLAKGTTITVTYTATLNANAVVGDTGNPNEAWLEYGAGYTTTVDTVITYTTKFVVEKVDGKDQPLKGAEFTLSKLVGENYEVIGTGTADTAGTVFTWNGLEAGTYKIEETKVPDGYNKADDVLFTINCVVPGTVGTTADKATWSVPEGTVGVTATAGSFNARIQNLTGNLLPETGGIGTTIFYVVGGLLMAAALIVLVSKKRMASFA